MAEQASEIFVTASDLCARWGITRGTLYNWRKANRVPTPIRIGRELRWNLEDVRSFERVALKRGDLNQGRAFWNVARYRDE